MTFKETLLKTHPEIYDFNEESDGCPFEFNLESDNIFCAGHTCHECWNREFPEANISGVTPAEPTVTNSQGGKQARSLYAFHLLDTDAMLSIARVMQEGSEKYERDNWREIPAEEHFNHLAIHWYAWLKGDRSDDHLAHMFTRAMMCYACAKAEDANEDR